MNLKNHKVSLFFLKISFILGSLIFFSCNKSSICLTPKVVALRGGFYYQDTALLYKDSVQTNANIIFGTDFKYYLNIKKSSKFLFSLSQVSDSLTVLFQSDSTSTEPETIDSISFSYTRESHFISTACGIETFFSIQNIQYSHNIIDTIIVSSNAVNNDVNKENIKIVIKK